MSIDKFQQSVEDETNGLPEGWCWVALSEIVNNPKSDIVDGPFGSDLKASEYVNEGVPIIRIQNVERNRFIEKNIRSISPKKAEELKRHNFYPGDIVITKLGDPLGKACVVPNNFRPGIVVADIVRLRLNHGLCSIPYLTHGINSKIAAEQLLQHVKGTTRPRVNLGIVRALKIPLPPLAEQKRITSKLEELLGQIDTTKHHLANVTTILSHFRQAVLTAACSGRLTADWRKENQSQDLPEGSELPPGWHWMPIKELLSSGGIFDGPFGSNLKTADYSDNGVRVIRLENVGFLQFFHQKETYISQEKYKTLSKHTVGGGDIIFASFIDEEVRACVLPKLKTKAIAKADCFCLRPRQEIVNRNYLTFQLVSRESYERLSENIHGATRPRINTTQLRNLEVRICPVAEQHEIIRRVEALFKFVGSIEKRVATATVRAEKLTQAILAKAFRGELVPTEAELARREDRSYESASVLLARINSKRESGGVPQKGFRSRSRSKES